MEMVTVFEKEAFVEAQCLECRSLDRENPVTNPLHIMVPLVVTRYGSVMPRQKQNPCTVLYLILGNKLIYLFRLIPG